MDFSYHALAAQLSGDCDIINDRLWRHRKNVGASEWGIGSMSFSSYFIDSLCREIKCMFSRDELFIHSLECYFGVYSPSSPLE